MMKLYKKSQINTMSPIVPLDPLWLFLTYCDRQCNLLFGQDELAAGQKKVFSS